MQPAPGFAHRAHHLYVSQRRDESVLKARIKEITDTRVHYGYRRVHVMLRREGHLDNVKRVYRLYREEGLSLRLKHPRRNKAAKRRQPKQLAHAINEIWSMDLVADALFDGRKLRILTVADLFTRECLAIDVGRSLRGEDVVRVLTAITYELGVPRTLKSDKGREFISKVMDKWAYERGVEPDFRRPGKATDNANVESFNRRLRQECLNAPGSFHWTTHEASRGLAEVLQRESSPLIIGLDHARRIRPSLQVAACNDDLRGAGNLHF